MSTKAAPVVDLEQLRRYLKREQRFWGGRVRARREDLGLTLEQVADMTGSTAPTIFKIEQGKIAPRDHLRIALAFALATEVDRLFPIPNRETISREAS
jgi:transcriptional regulator with XRE-family HTH domain